MFKKIVGTFEYDFNVMQDGLYSIAITARCKSSAQLGIQGGEDLVVDINGRTLREVPPIDRPQYQNIPSAWNGTKLKDLKKTIIFLVVLTKGNHRLSFTAIPSATLEHEPQIKDIADGTRTTFPLDDVAEDGDRRPWYTFALIDLPLKSFSVDITASWRGVDHDDAKLIVDGVVKRHPAALLHRYWLWSGSLLNKLLGHERQLKAFQGSLPKAIHYIELWADRMPTLHNISFNLGQEQFKRIPTVDDPRWTGDFADDTDQMILARVIFSEARSAKLSERARVAVGWSIKNRVQDFQSRWSTSYFKVITQKAQYSSLSIGDPNRSYVDDPIGTGNILDKKAWIRCYEIAGNILANSVEDPTGGANHFYDESIRTPSWATKNTFIIKIDTLFFHRL
jgi:hypothetical protein